MIVLGIESSCDETSCAIVNDSRKVLAHTVLSQDEHRIYGGVVPEIAARSHLEHIDKIIDKTINDSGVKLKDIDAVAVASGPGLIGGLIVGVMAGKAIAMAHNKPFIPINHLEGHALMPRLTNDVQFPYLLLLVSGGHTQIILVKGVGNYKILGTSIDDACGECFDKVAKVIDVGYPGGPMVDKMASKGDDKAFNFPKPLAKEDNMNFSFSGLKSAVKRIYDMEVQANSKKAKSKKFKEDICASFQKAVCDVIEIKVQKALSSDLVKRTGVKSLVVSGGAGANSGIRSVLKKVAKDNKVKFCAPPVSLCTDNGAMIAWAGLENFKNGKKSDLSFAPRPRWSLEDLGS